ncbi:MAG: hypothetical protein QOG60_2266, partial [Frankiaceae bacterium]|nr:hypothetical protein [Frankiaceae bacterium]
RGRSAIRRAGSTEVSERPATPEPARRHRGRHALIGAAVLLAVLVVLVVLETRLTRLGGLGGGRYRLLTGLLLWWGLAAAGVLVLRQLGRRTAIVLLLVGAVALPAASLTSFVQISDDVFRYAWDGRVQAAGIDPYRYPPSAPELRGLRDPWLWPDDATCAVIDRAERPCTRINRLNVRTIYPPVAEAWFYTMHVLPGPDLDRHQRFYASLLSVLLAILLVVVLPRLGRDPRLAALYAWSPVAGFDIASDGHVDVLAGVFAVGAVALAVRRQSQADADSDSSYGLPSGARARGRFVLSAVLAGAAVAVKLYPALLLPALVQPLRGVRRVLGAAVFAMVALGFVLLTYLPHIAVVGPDVLGYLPGYLQEEQYGGEATRYLLLGLLGLPPSATQLCAVLALLAALLWTLTSRAPVPVRAVGMVGAAFLIATPVQPWYALLLVVLATLAARPEWLLVAAAAYPAYFSAVLRDPRFIGIGQLGYVVAVVGVLLATVVRRRMNRRKSQTYNTVVIQATDLQPSGGSATKP